MENLAVEWYNQQIVDRQNGNADSRSRDEIFEQAKEMEKEQKGYSEEDMKQFGLYLGDNLKKLKGKSIDELFTNFKQQEQ
jgi:hypothetical protein